MAAKIRQYAVEMNNIREMAEASTPAQALSDVLKRHGITWSVLRPASARLEGKNAIARISLLGGHKESVSYYVVVPK